MAAFTRDLRQAAARHPALVFASLVFISMLAFVHTLEGVPGFEPLVQTTTFKVFHATHDVVAAALALFLAYAYSVALGATLIVLSLVLHGPYLYLGYPESMVGLLQKGLVVGVTLAGIKSLSLWKGSRERARLHTARLQALHDVSQTVAGSLDLGSVSQMALESVMKAVDLDAGIIRYVDEATGELVLLAHRGLPADLAREVNDAARIQKGLGLAGYVVETGAVAVADDLPRNGNRLFPSATKAGFQSFIGMPLVGRNKVVGAISGLSFRRRSFNADDLEMLTSLANMVGMAVSDARLFQQVEAGHRQWEQTFDSMGDGVAIMSRDNRVIRANWALAAILGTTPMDMIGRTCHELLHDSPVPLADCPLELCKLHKRPCALTRQEPHLGNRWFHMSIDPVIGPGGEVEHVIHTFRDITQERQQQEQLQRLHRLSRTLSSSLDLDQVVGLALRELESTFGGAGVTIGIALLDDWRQQLKVVGAVGAMQNAAKQTVMLAALHADVVRLLLDEHKPWLQPDISQSSDVLKAIPGFEQHKTMVALPMVAGQRSIGVLFLLREQPDLPGPADIEMLETYAREIALAVENARLYTRTDVALRRRISEAEALNSVLSAATGSLDLDNILGQALASAVQALAVDRAGVLILEEGGRKIAIQLDHRAGATGASSPPRDIELANVPLLAEALRNRQPLVVEDARSLPDGGDRLVVEQLGLRSFLLVPMVLGGRAVGSLAFSTTWSPRSYSSQDVLLAQAMAGHLASIVENARLYKRTADERSTLESIMTSMAEGLVVTDARGCGTYCNRAAEEVLGIRAQDFVGRSGREYLALLSSRVVEPSDLPFVLNKAYEELGRRGGTLKLDLTVQDAQPREVECLLFAIRRGDELLGYGAVLRDVTRERQADRMKSDFISIASHELRTPLTAVYGFAELLLSRADNLSDRQRKWLETVYRESKRLSDIVHDLLDLSRIEAGRLSLNLEPVAVGPVARRVVEHLSAPDQVHQVRVDVPDDLPPALADSDKVYRILYNLVDNAIKYSPRGGAVTVNAHVDQGRGRLVFSVADEGLGIPEAEVPNLFTRFHRVQRPETAGLRGTGLGLHIVKSLVTMMKGDIRVSTRVGVGSTFSVSLPLAAAEASRQPGHERTD